MLYDSFIFKSEACVYVKWVCGTMKLPYWGPYSCMNFASDRREAIDLGDRVGLEGTAALQQSLGTVSYLRHGVTTQHLRSLSCTRAFQCLSCSFIFVQVCVHAPGSQQERLQCLLPLAPSTAESSALWNSQRPQGTAPAPAGWTSRHSFFRQWQKLVGSGSGHDSRCLLVGRST